VAILLASSVLAACGDSETPTAAQSGTAPRTVGGSLPSPLDPATPNGEEPVPPSSQAPRSVQGSLPSPTPPPESAASPPAPPRAVAAFTFTKGGLRPASRSVPSSTRFDLTIVAADGRRHTVVLKSTTDYVLRPRPGRPATVTIDGLPAGTYSLAGDGGRARLVVTAPR
jgi:hypothetical protein